MLKAILHKASILIVILLGIFLIFKLSLFHPEQGEMEFCIINELGNEPYQIDDSIQLVAYTDSLWKSEDKLIIAFVNGTNFEKEYFKSLTSEWLSLINLNVVFQDSLKNSVVRIKFNNSGIARSFLGRQAVLAPLNEPTLSLPRYVDSSKFRRNVLHEFGHVLGLVHEHQSPLNEIPWKKNFLYAKLILNGLSKRTIDKNFFSKYSHKKTQYSQFDIHSIMIYPIHKNWVKDEKFAVPLNSKLSETDMKYIKKIYP